MITYEPQIIFQFADRLYKKANSVILAHTLAGLGIGALIGSIINGVMHLPTGSGEAVFPLLLALIGALIGHRIGDQKAFALKLQAQTALVMVRIEENTRAMLTAVPRVPSATPASHTPAE